MNHRSDITARIFLLLILITGLGGCGSNASSGSSTLVRLDLSVQNPNETPSASVSPVAAVVASVKLEVTGPGMNPVTDIFNAASGETVTRTLDIPSGPGRIFTATAFAGTDASGLALYLGQSDPTDLEPGGTASISITMAPLSNNVLTVAIAGTGTGSVTSSPAGIDCGTTCAASFDSGTLVTLTAVPDAGSVFAGWSGDGDCSDGLVTIDAAKSCTANFLPLLQTGQLRVILTWGENPVDLDSHLCLPPASPYHVYFGDRGNLASFPFAALDIDDTDSFGPETVTIAQKLSGTYVYAVHNFSGTPDLSASAAVVRVFNDAGLVNTFNVPAVGSGRVWHVFDLDGDTGAITPVNAIGDAVEQGGDVICPTGPITSAALTSIVVSPAVPAIGPGQALAFTATGLFADNSARDLSSSVIWSSSDEAVATIDAAGLATGLSTGSTTITATDADSGLSGSVTLTVTTISPGGGGGTLTVTGAPASVGGSFVANEQLSTQDVQGGIAVILWGETSNGSHGEALELIYDYGTDQFLSIVFASTESGVGDGWSCTRSQGDSGCAGATVDRTNGTLTFVNTVLEDVGLSNPPITLDGTLNFTPF